MPVSTEGGQEGYSSGTPSGAGGSFPPPKPRGSRLVSKRTVNAGSFAANDEPDVPDAPTAPTYSGGGSRLDSAAGNLVTSQEAVENRKHVFMSLAIATFLSLVTYGIKWPK